MSDPINTNVTKVNGIEVQNLSIEGEHYDDVSKLKLTPNKGLKMKENPFAECTSVEQLLYQLAGRASMCWEHVDKADVFDDVEARQAVDDAMYRLRELLESVIAYDN